MKYILTTVICCTLMTLSLQAQELDFDTVVKTEDEVASFEEYLVYLAWLNSPTTQQLSHRQEIAAIQIKEAKLGWLEGFTPFVNYNIGNSINIGQSMPENPPNDQRTTLSTGSGDAWGIGMGVSFRLLPLFTTKHKVAAAEEHAK
ncbi:MAG: hypothetical protein AAF738_06275, partial [Bacteroidota bacterium]